MAAKKKKSAKGAAKQVAKKAAKKVKSVAKKIAKKRVQAVPEQYGTATAYLIASPAKDALEYYKKAFGAKTLSVMEGPGGVVMHGEFKVGDSIIMISDEMPPMPGMPQGTPRKSPKSAGASTGGAMLYVKNCDAVHDAAVAAGGTSLQPPTDMFWGDRYAQIEDPFGHSWSIATHLRDVSEKELREAMASMGPPPGQS